MHVSSPLPDCRHTAQGRAYSAQSEVECDDLRVGSVGGAGAPGVQPHDSPQLFHLFPRLYDAGFKLIRPFTCRLPAITTALHRLRLPYLPSVALYVVETTLERRFESYLRSHSLQ